MNEKAITRNQSSLRSVVRYLTPRIVMFVLTVFGVTPVNAQLPLLQATDLVYVGAFRVPDGTFGASEFNYGGGATAYNAANNSLFMVGHDQHPSMVAEIRIPNIVNSSNLGNLAVATVLQNFADPTEGKINTIGDTTNGVILGGMVVDQGKLYGTTYLYYDAGSSQNATHFYRDTPTLSGTGHAHGMYMVGSVGAGYTSGYMNVVPSEWQSTLGGPWVTGNCCIPIISRTSAGPSLHVFNPADLGVQNPVPAIPLVYYPLDSPLAPVSSQNNLFNLTTQITGVLFPSGTRSVLFVGSQGTGPYCYGESPSCNDPANAYKGPHAYPYVPQVWAYDVNDLAAVKNGQKQPWQIKPYATWSLNLPFVGVSADLRMIGGVAWDPQTRRVFVTAKRGDSARPVVHVFQIGGGGEARPPMAPTGLLVQ